MFTAGSILILAKAHPLQHRQLGMFGGVPAETLHHEPRTPPEDVQAAPPAPPPAATRSRDVSMFGARTQPAEPAPATDRRTALRGAPAPAPAPAFTMKAAAIQALPPGAHLILGHHQTGIHTVPVKSLREAGRQMTRYQTDNGLGMRHALDQHGDVVDNTGRVHAQVSSNGRVWGHAGARRFGSWSNLQSEVLGAELDRPLVGPGSGREPHELDHPPAGFSPIPGSDHSGYHKRGPDGHWLYWYQGKGATTGPHEADHPDSRAMRAIDPNPIKARWSVREALSTHKFVEGQGDASGAAALATLPAAARKRIAGAGVGLRARQAHE